MDEVDVGTAFAASERHLKRIEDEVGAHVAGELQPTIARLNASMMNAKNTTPSQQRR